MSKILIPRNLEGRQEKIKQKWYRLFQQEVIDGNVIINMDLDIDPSKVKTKKINGHVWLSNTTKIPKFFKNIEINGWFSCSHNKLTSLEGCPQIVNSSFWCSFNNLTSLEGCPKIIGDSFDCAYNNLTSLEGCPKEVKKNFYCFRNDKEFTEEEVKKYCQVGGKII